ncbi:MAG: SCP2 sterol-binding domain-containing protein [Acidimicrobiia bacterium]|nr:SCP2 sterol-binding domain-containing protein [Acidimicrobiia bacterium]
MSIPFLSQQWLDRYADLLSAAPQRPGVDARTQYVVTGGPDGDVAYFVAVEDGRVAEAKVGTDGDADTTVTRTYADAAKILQGELDPDAAFMQGRAKVAGSMRPVLALLPLTTSPEYAAARAELAAVTDL